MGGKSELMIDEGMLADAISSGRGRGVIFSAGVFIVLESFSHICCHFIICIFLKKIKKRTKRSEAGVGGD